MYYLSLEVQQFINYSPMAWIRFSGLFLVSDVEGSFSVIILVANV